MSSQIQRNLEKWESGVLLHPGCLVQPALMLKERITLVADPKKLPFEVWGRDGHVSAGDWECELEPSRFSPTSVPRKAKLLEALSFFGKISLPMSSTGALRPRGQAPI